MGSDGAQEGYGAEQAMKAIIGGEDPGEPVTTREMAERVMSTDITAPPRDYGQAADVAAKLIVLWLREDPARAAGPVETVYAKDAGGNTDYGAVDQPGWYELMKESGDGERVRDLGLSGFQWGWAVNAARAILELPAVPNPAIIDVRVEP